MDVIFYILFLLVASPVKKEEACRTTKRQSSSSTHSSTSTGTAAVASNSNGLTPPPPQSVATSSDNGQEKELASNNQESITTDEVPPKSKDTTSEDNDEKADNSKKINVAITVPTVSIDSSVTEYEYGHKIILKWSITDLEPDMTVVTFKMQLFNEPKSDTDQGSDVQCTKEPSDNYYHCQLPELEPGAYTTELQVTFSNEEIGEIPVTASGTFTVKTPALTIKRPVDNHICEHGLDVDLEWSMTYSNGDVTDMKVSVWNAAKTPDNADTHPVPCDDSTRRKLEKVSIGTYKWTVAGVVIQSGQTMKNEGEGSFTVVAIPVPVLVKSVLVTYLDDQKIDVVWRINDPNKIIDKDGYHVLVWELNKKGDVDKEDVYQSYLLKKPDCTDEGYCESWIPKQTARNDGYRYKVMATTKGQQKTISANQFNFKVQDEYW